MLNSSYSRTSVHGWTFFSFLKVFRCCFAFRDARLYLIDGGRGWMGRLLGFCDDVLWRWFGNWFPQQCFWWCFPSRCRCSLSLWPSSETIAAETKNFVAKPQSTILVCLFSMIIIKNKKNKKEMCHKSECSIWHRLDSENLTIARCIWRSHFSRSAAEMLFVKSFIREFAHTRIIHRRIEFRLRYKILTISLVHRSHNVFIVK